MPVSKPPRKPRGVPQHRRDLQRMDKPMPAPTSTARKLSGKSKVGLGLAGAAATVGGIAALNQTPRGKARRTLYQNRNNPQFKEALTHQIGVNMAARQLRAAGLDVKVRGEVDKAATTHDATNVRRLQPRHPSGRFVSHTNDLMVIHPRYSTSRRAPRDSKLQCWGKGKDSQSKTYLGKASGWRTSSKVPLIARRLHSIFDDPYQAANATGSGTHTSYPWTTREYDALRTKQRHQRRDAKLVGAGAAGGAAVTGGAMAAHKGKVKKADQGALAESMLAGGPRRGRRLV